MGKTKKLVLNALNQPEFFSEAEIKFFEKWLKEKERQKQIKKLEKNLPSDRHDSVWYNYATIKTTVTQ